MGETPRRTPSPKEIFDGARFRNRCMLTPLYTYPLYTVMSKVKKKTTELRLVPRKASKYPKLWSPKAPWTKW